MIPQPFIQELLSRVDVVDVVGRYVQLKKAGANFMGLCPFHGEKSPSFTVSAPKQFYHCFGCGANGTAISFLMEHAGLSFPDAVADLAQAVGLTVPQEPGRGGPGAADSGRRDPDLLEVMTNAAKFYKRRLKDSPRAIDYLKRRGLTGETAARYGIGYAPEAWRGLEAAVADYNAPELLTVGLVIESTPAGGSAPVAPAVSSAPAGAAGVAANAAVTAAANAAVTAAAGVAANAAAGSGVAARAGAQTGPRSDEAGAASGGSPESGAAVPGGSAGAAAPPPGVGANVQRRRFDRFRDRIMFPIRNPRGQVIGFGGRVLDKGEPKYMNSPETPLFSKGHELYGLFEGRDALRQSDCAVVVEGYMDVVMLAQHGVGNAVATLGTATTPDHVRKLLRQVDRVVFAFDGDKAGRKAAWRALEACLPMVADTKRLDFLFLPAEHDPDSYVREFGPDGFRALLEQALSLSEFLVRELGGRVDLEQAEGRAHFLAEARPLLLALPQAALRIQLIHRVAEQARVSTAELNEYLAQAAASAGPRARQGAATHGAGRAPGAAGSRGGGGYATGQGGAGPTDPDDHQLDANDWGAYASGGPSWADEDGFGSAADYAPADRYGEGAGGQAPRGGRGGWQGSQGGGQGGGGSGEWRGKGKWEKRDGARGGRFERDLLPRQRSPAKPPALLRRVTLLAALHPALAHDPVDPGFLPTELVDWLEWLRTLPPGASFAVICESLRVRSPPLVAQLERDAATDKALVVDMNLDSARLEFTGALLQLRDKGLRQAITELVAGGLAGTEDRQRLQELQALRLKA